MNNVNQHQNDSAIAVLGAGAWGTALAIHLANYQPTRLWDFNPEHIQTLRKDRCNTRYLPGVLFPKQLHLYDDLDHLLAGTTDVLIVIPSHAFRSVIAQLKPYVENNSGLRIAWATKGLDPQSGQLLDHVVRQYVAESTPLAVISGPSFATELAKQLMTALTLSCHDPVFTHDLHQRLHHGCLRVYTNTDLIGTQLGGAVKNVFAIAAGIADGLGLGANARAALITRGLHEMMQLGKVLGAHQNTLMGLSGMGDLILTCTDNQSRNRRFGLALGQGETLEQAKSQIDQVIEGILTTEQLYKLGAQHHVDMPITTQMYQVLYQQKSPKQAVLDLLAREAKSEFD